MATFGVVGGALLGGGSAATPLTVASAMSTSVVVTANTAAHTKGAWTELIASTSATCTAVYLDAGFVAAASTDSSTLVDIAVGGSGAESPVVSDIPIGGANNPAIPLRIFLPLAIPAGSRVSARVQSVTTDGKAVNIAVHLLTGGAHYSAATLVTLGSSTATSAGTSVGTSWTQIVASAAATYRALVPVPSLSSAAATNSTGPLEIASGGAGAETLIGTTLPLGVTTSEQIAGSAPTTVPGVAAGTRISMRRTAGPIHGAVLAVI